MVVVTRCLTTMTAGQYRDNWTGGPPVGPPPGLIFHARIGDSAACFTVSVWESRAAYDVFAPVFAQAMRERGFEFGRPEILPCTFPSTVGRVRRAADAVGVWRAERAHTRKGRCHEGCGNECGQAHP